MKLVTFTYQIPEIFICLCYLGLVAISTTPKTNHSWLWAHQNPPSNSKRIQKHVGGKIIWGKLRIPEKCFWGKGACRKVLVIRLIRSWKPRMWNQYLQKTMEWKFGISELNWRNSNNCFSFSIKKSPTPTPAHARSWIYPITSGSPPPIPSPLFLPTYPSLRH